MHRAEANIYMKDYSPPHNNVFDIGLNWKKMIVAISYKRSETV